MMLRKKNAIRRELCRQRPIIDGHTHVGADMALHANGDYPYAQSAEDMLVRLDSWDVGAAVCFPLLYTSYFKLRDFRVGRFVRDAAAGHACPYAFENERLCREVYDIIPGAAGRLLPFAFFDPGRRAKEQVATVRALAERYPIFGLKTATSYLHSPIRDLMGKGGVLLDLAAELDVPVTIHSSVLPTDPYANVRDILDVARSRPDVRFAIAHTCRFHRRSLEDAAALPNCFVDFSAFHIHCKLAVQNHGAVAVRRDRFPTDYRRDAVAMREITAAYPDTMIWGSDTPAHYFFSRYIQPDGKVVTLGLSCGRHKEIETLRSLPKATQRRIGTENTLRFLFGARQG